MRFHTLLPGVRVLPAAMVCAAVFLAVSMSGCIAWAQDPIPVKELKQNFDRTYKNEEVRVHGQVSAEKRVDSQTYKGFYLKDRFGDLILVRTTAPLPEISSFVTVTGVALRDADTGDVFVSETRREGGTAPAAAAAPAPAAGGAPAPADDSARRQAEEQRMREEEERRKAEQEADDQRQMLMLGGIGLAIAVLIGIAVYLMRRKPEPELAAPMFAPSAPAQPPAEKTQPGAPPPPPIERPALGLRPQAQPAAGVESPESSRGPVPSPVPGVTQRGAARSILPKVQLGLAGALLVAGIVWVVMMSPSGSGSAGNPVTGPYGMVFVPLSEGEFVMGCAQGDGECDDVERPAHRVRITKGFEIGKYEVTQAQWEAVMGSNPSFFKGADRPVEQVSWEDVQQFLSRLNARGDGYRYRLPTEAEWEYAARAGTTGKYYGELDEIAWYGGNSDWHTHPVGQKKPNAWGLYDMLGNVWEWCSDWYDWNYYRSSPEADPREPESRRYRSLRGGSWYVHPRDLRVSYRGRFPPSTRFNSLGFRCVRER